MSLSLAAAVLTILAIFSLAIAAANTLVSERIGQTLEVLLTTPLSARQIIREKARALHRLEWILAIPLLTVFGSRAFLLSGSSSWGNSSYNWFLYLTCTVLVVFIYLPMTTWFALWIGARVRTRHQAILTVLGVIIFFILLCPCLFFLIDTFGGRFSSPLLNSACLLSPFSVPVMNEVGALKELWHTDGQWLVIICNALVYGGVTVLLRNRVYTRADRWLRR